MREFGEFHTPPSALEMVLQDVGLDGPERLDAPALPHPMERAEACRAELASARGKVEI
jgi:hypothetical protein